MSVPIAGSSHAIATRIPVTMCQFGPAVPIGEAAWIVGLSEEGLAIEGTGRLPADRVVGLAFRMAKSRATSQVVAVASVVRASTAVGAMWRSELRYDQLTRGDAELIASAVAQDQFRRDDRGAPT